jgi:ATP-dependent exoDNAse (exonuclease V) alpha subunit
MITLNQGQQAAHDQLVSYLLRKDNSHAMWLLKGYAGTGKTTTIGTVLQSVFDHYARVNAGSYLSMSPAIAVSAPTHKAVQVLKKMQTFSSNVEYATIHSLLGLKEYINPVTGKQEFKQDLGGREPRIEGFNILILDETSMLSNELFVLLEPYVYQGLRLVMMGDPVQIPPVNEADPIPFIESEQVKHNIGVMELTEVVRQAADNPILEYATELRKVYKTGNPKPVTKLHEGKGIEVIEATQQKYMIDLLESLFNTLEFDEDPDHAKVIAWTNATVNSTNNTIRKLIYRDVLAERGFIPLIMKGEKLICDKPIKDLFKDVFVLQTNMEVEVIDYTIKAKKIGFELPGFQEDGQNSAEFDIRYYDCIVEYDQLDNAGKVTKKRTNIHIMHEESLELFRKYQEQHKQATVKQKNSGIKAGMWRKYYANEEKFAWMKYNYAITAHKSQGSTYNKVIMVNWDMDKNKRVEERNRIKYVAATRPRQMLYIVN